MKTLKAESIIKTMILAIFMVMGTCMSANAQQTNNDQNVRQRMSREQLAEVQANHIAKVIGRGADKEICRNLLRLPKGAVEHWTSTEAQL